jgi:hypothetical protein
MAVSGVYSGIAEAFHGIAIDWSKTPIAGKVILAPSPGKTSGAVDTHFSARGAIAFLPDGKSAVISTGVAVSVYDLTTSLRKRDLPDTAGVRRLAVSSDGKRVLTAGFTGEVALRDLDSGRILWKLPRHGNGQVLSVRLFDHDRRALVVQSDGSSRFLDTEGGQWIADLAQLNNGNWLTVTPDGRFDTPDLDSSMPLHWIASDAPLKPLPVEMFQRDYYEPRLLTRVLAGEKLPPVRNLAELNRVLPSAAVTAAVPETDMPGTIRLQIEIAEGRDPKTGRTSGAQNLRVFRDGRLVAYQPPEDGAIRLENGKATFDLRHIRIQFGHLFSVYAFNSDGVKTETKGYRYRRDTGLVDAGHNSGREQGQSGLMAQPPAIGRRAWLIPIGVDASALPALNLRYSASDARRLSGDLAQRLEDGHLFAKVITTPLIADAAHPDAAAKEAIHQAVAGLAGNGPNAAGLNDLVIVSFSGHGYAGPDGRFYLIPSDAGRGLAGADGRLPSSESARARLLRESISSDELSHWLRDVDAGRIVLIIDACQSAAALGGDGFKPGPMGSRGLGQLAYDKGLTILAATQADNVALESGAVAQGLLTYALTHDGLERMAADFQPKDGRIDLREWLSYGVGRVPDLWAAIQAGEMRQDGETRLLVIGTPPNSKGGVRQEPALFDFARSGVDPILVTAPPKPGK